VTQNLDIFKGQQASTYYVPLSLPTHTFSFSSHNQQTHTHTHTCSHTHAHTRTQTSASSDDPAFFCPIEVVIDRRLQAQYKVISSEVLESEKVNVNRF